MKLFNWRDNKGQSLVEIIVGLAISAILITAAAGAIALTLKESFEIKTSQVAASLSQQYLDNVQAMVESDWSFIRSLHLCSPSWHLAASGTTYAAIIGSTTTIVFGKTFTRYFSTQIVNRDSCGVGDITENSLIACSMELGSGYVATDPSTIKITSTVNWENRTIFQSQYLMRYRNFVLHQSDWAGGDGQNSFATTSEGVIVNNKFASSTNINFSATSGSLFVSAPMASGTLVSSIYDSWRINNEGKGTKAALNSIVWQGEGDSQGVKFQVASSNCFNGADNSPNCTLGVGWDYRGPDGTSNTYYNAFSPDDSVQINLAYHNEKRYFRYKIFIQDSDGNLSAPRINDISINFSVNTGTISDNPLICPSGP